MVSIDQFKEIEVRAGKILRAEAIEGSEKLLRLTVDFGEQNPRQIISGIKRYFEDPAILVGVTCAFVTNLEPRTILGLESQGMIMAASGSGAGEPSDKTGEFFSLLKMDAPPGSLVK